MYVVLSCKFRMTSNAITVSSGGGGGELEIQVNRTPTRSVPVIVYERFLPFTTLCSCVVAYSELCQIFTFELAIIRPEWVTPH